ncbi:efflux RND transporter periplasmic adaptor subunit [Komagataeibacter oboediens]|uniref:HlyD family efflux transporter periplasmic adaptor subunit n=1 Tax=Komagataeibacter oboediens TaxID=65958 RepID=A0ABS5SP47_9PROT|nr:HlyD family efflux transporter periplasmic adaptor subunit [Komagataeibacter oboediens]MBL7233043.1 HlyD family efflux transporter periplasmic adaptor subunit [Komagataeibacter oboediens]MBT0675936.1 HlyD family efflux transporter periplasmic adaptor subunit [Komagataeibacter oboediens]MBT0677810.1 HlyD family efflux transporter periplasmic adaptor subunit [Komagataeibacter oboediens]
MMSPPDPARMQSGRQAALLRLSVLVHQCERLRTCPADELDFVLVNETHNLLPYQQAALYRVDMAGMAAVSGTAVFDPSAPYVRWLRRVFDSLAPQTTPALLDPAALPADVRDEWQQWLAPHAVLIPLSGRHGPVGTLLVARAEEWTQPDIQALGMIGGEYAESRQLVASRPPRPRNRRVRRRVAAMAAIAVAVALYPAHSWVLAPAEVVPVEPSYVRAPFAGIVHQLDVAPNTPVRAGTPLVELERAQLESQYQVARKGLEVARTQYDEAIQAGMLDAKARAQAGELKGRIDEEAAQMRYQSELLHRATLTAPIDGLALYNDPSEWVGRPVEAGERILMVAPALSRRIEIRLPVTETAHFDPGARVRFFDNVHPDHPADGHLVFTSYASTPTPAGTLAYTLRADLDHDIRLGLRGTVRIYGPRHMLVLWALRRPLGVVRQWLSF